MGILRDTVFKNEYKYYDTAEGEDCHKKLWYVTKYCGIYGVFASSVDTLLFSHPKGYAATLGRYAYITFPVMGMGAAFVTSVCMATNLRGKDDRLNYAFGGAVTGAVLGAWQKSLKHGSYAAILFALMATVQKDSILSNYQLFDSQTPTMYTNFEAIKRDYSLLKDPGRDWKYKNEA